MRKLNMNTIIRKATTLDIDEILRIVEDARIQIKALDFKQWTNNYPNYETFKNDILNDELYVIVYNKKVVGMMALVKALNLDYNKIDGKWLSNTKYYTIHRLAIKKEYRHLTLAQELFNYAYKIALNDSVNLRIDTHPKNAPMINLITKMGYSYCGKIILLNEKTEPLRLAYELIIPNSGI